MKTINVNQPKGQLPKYMLSAKSEPKSVRMRYVYPDDALASPDSIKTQPVKARSK